MDELLQFIRDMSQSRTLHRIAVVVHGMGVVFFAWAYSRIPSNVFLFFMGWCVLYGSQSSMVLLRKGRK